MSNLFLLRQDKNKRWRYRRGGGGDGGVRPKVWNPYPYVRIFLSQKTADLMIFSINFRKSRPISTGVSTSKRLILQFSWFFRIFCEMGPSPKDSFEQNGFWWKSNPFGRHIPVCLSMWVPPGIWPPKALRYKRFTSTRQPHWNDVEYLKKFDNYFNIFKSYLNIDRNTNAQNRCLMRWKRRYNSYLQDQLIFKYQLNGYPRSLNYPIGNYGVVKTNYNIFIVYITALNVSITMITVNFVVTPIQRLPQSSRRKNKGVNTTLQRLKSPGGTNMLSSASKKRGKGYFFHTSSRSARTAFRIAT